MITNDSTKGASLKEIRERDKKEKEVALRELCEAIAVDKYGKDKIVSWSNTNKGLWYLPVFKIDEPDAIEFMLVMKPINRHILSYASTKITDEGLYAFLEVAMRECMVEGDPEIFDDEECFLAASNKFNSILETRKAALLKR